MEGDEILELNEKLQELRKKKGITQEELAEALYVSRTAISKWESGRGVPSIDSLKAISKYFSVSIDSLLSGEELLEIAGEDLHQRENRIRGLIFGLLDLCMLMFLFLPLFAERSGEAVKSVSLLSLGGVSVYVKIAYFAIIAVIILAGILALVLQNFDVAFWVKHRYKISAVLGVAATGIFIVTLQPYAALFSFVFLAIKVFMLIKIK
jgi:transcriptional regulator with XRE-family HTH domain